MKAPVIFLCRNNRWAISVPSEKQTASVTFAEKGVAYGIPGLRVDGNDILATWKVVRECVEKSAAGAGPFLIEMLTYRVGGHSTSDDPRASTLLTRPTISRCLHVLSLLHGSDY